jgi:high-affinity Fe2+/Pb2+ permease
MKMFIDFSISIALGWLVAWGLAALVGLAYPAAFYPVLLILAAGWAWIGWRNTSRRGWQRQQSPYR